MGEGRYHLTEKPLGSGGQAVVWEAKDNFLERSVAVKSLAPAWKNGPADEKEVERLRREARTLANLSHPAIPAVYDLDLTEEPRIIFEYIRGKNLREILSDRRPVLPEIVNWLVQVCSALSHAHARDVIHRDVKPANIIVREDESGCCLVDFGLALHPDDKQRLSSTIGVGTPGYMSPEQVRGEKLDGQADVYAVGVVLYELIANKLPKPEDYEPLAELDETVPPAIDELIRDALKPREMRVASAKEFADRLRAALVVKTSIADVLAEGRLHELTALLSDLSPSDYAALKAGQRTLVRERVRIVVESEASNLVRAGRGLIAELVRLGAACDHGHYGGLIARALEWGFDKQFDEHWRGDPVIRDALLAAAREVGSLHHKAFTAELVRWSAGAGDPAAWYLEAARGICQRLMANQQCDDDDAVGLGGALRTFNDRRFGSRE